MSKDWHSGHFSCWQCDEALTGQRYVLRDDHPYCIKCYESVFANVCEECNKIIGIDSKVNIKIDLIFLLDILEDVNSVLHTKYGGGFLHVSTGCGQNGLARLDHSLYGLARTTRLKPVETCKPPPCLFCKMLFIATAENELFRFSSGTKSLLFSPKEWNILLFF